ncbi:MAG TPA: choice-of-anchor B family protein, partial [Anaerolineae bacterium]|nr:choice-of-anchor B family protein [Anaerolineae bacterium]
MTTQNKRYSRPLSISLLVSFLLLLFVLPIQAGNGRIACIDGEAAGFSCNNVDLLAHLPLSAIGGDADNGVLASDIWGWTSPNSGKRYALVGLRNATSFVDVTDPLNPVYLGKLPAQGTALSPYRDFKVYQNYAFIVGDAPFVNHGMQVFDLLKLDSA